MIAVRWPHLEIWANTTRLRALDAQRLDPMATGNAVGEYSEDLILPAHVAHASAMPAAKVGLMSRKSTRKGPRSA